MKKSKVLIGLTATSCFGLALPNITSCSCSNKYNVIYVSHLSERDFNDRSGGCTFRFKVANQYIAKKTEVKLVELRVDGELTLPVVDFIDYSYDVEGYIKVVVYTDYLLYWYPWAEKFNFKFLFTNTETKETVTLGSYTLNYDDSLKVYEFEQCSWDVIKERTENVYNSSNREEAEKEFMSLFSIDGEQITSFDQFIGLEWDIKINGAYNKFRVIDVNHDTIAEGEHSGQKALFTFDLENLLSDSTGEHIATAWKTGAYDNTNYLNSTLKANLTGTPSWKDAAGNALPNALTMLTNDTPELADCIKTVTKEYHYREDNTWKLGTYSDKIFSPSYFEIAGCNDKTSLQEGTQYKYWNIHSKQADWQKYDLKDVRWNYWTISPCVGDASAINSSWMVWNSSRQLLRGCKTSTENAVTFSYCI